MISLLTPTDARPQAFALLERWVAEQDWPEPVQWIVATGDPAGYRFRLNQILVIAADRPGLHPLCRNLLAALPMVAGDTVLILEDDDYYAPGYVRTLAGLLEGAELAGLVPARYYNARTRRYRELSNTAHASLAQTGLRRAALPALEAACERGSPYVDKTLWGSYAGPARRERIDGLHVSVKGLPGAPGIGTGHRDDFGSPDPGFAVARSWGLPAAYERFYPPLGLDAAPALAAALPARRSAAFPAHEPRRIDDRTFVRTSQLIEDAQALARLVAPDVDGVVAIARSGLLPASIVATALHVPLWSVSPHSPLVSVGHGGRLRGAVEQPPRHLLVLDDTMSSGAALDACMPKVAAAFPDARVSRAAVYARPKVAHKVDVCAALYGGVHYLEWNWTNAGHGQDAGYDFDGVLCRDFTHDECRDMDTYRAAMARITPLYLPRRKPVALIATARPESTRELTEDWLRRHGVAWHRLEMWPGPWATPWPEIAAWKADHYGRSGCALFAESDPRQAEEIHRRTRRPVLCPALGRVLA